MILLLLIGFLFIVFVYIDARDFFQSFEDARKYSEKHDKERAKQGYPGIKM